MSGVIDRMSSEVEHAFHQHHHVLSFADYLQLLQKNPKLHVRSSAQYLVDMMDFWGQQNSASSYLDHLKTFGVFTAASPGLSRCPKIFGLETVQLRIYDCLKNFARAGRTNKLILLHGPNGSAKSTLCQRMMEGAAAYSQHEPGMMYGFSWIFPSERLGNKERIGFDSPVGLQSEMSSFAHLDGELVDARITCELRCHPLFLLPETQRLQHLRQLGLSEEQISSYVRQGNLCIKCSRIYWGLLENYQGNLSQLLRHVRVERIHLSRRYRNGLSTIEPQMSVDARIAQLTADHSLSKLPRFLQHLCLFELHGPLIDGNRGLIEFSDLFKRPVESFKYLISAIDTSEVSIESYGIYFDMVFLASCNDIYLQAFSKHPDFQSFASRTELIAVPYLRRIKHEVSVYQQALTDAQVGKHIAPLVLHMGAIFAVLTRLRPINSSLYPADQKAVVEGINAIEKAFLLDEQPPPVRFSLQQQNALRAALKTMYHEWDLAGVAEGGFGLSARELYSMLLLAAKNQRYRCLHPLAMLSNLQHWLETIQVSPPTEVAEESDFEALPSASLTEQLLRFSPQALIEQVTMWWQGQIESQLWAAMGLADDKSYIELFERYIVHVSHWVKKEKVFDHKTKQYHPPDERFMTEIERVLVQPKANANHFRFDLIGRIGAWSLEHTGERLDYADMFKVCIDALREDFFQAKRKVVQHNLNVYLMWVQKESVSENDRLMSESMLAYLKSQYGYCGDCAKDTVAYLLKYKYESVI